MADTSFLKSRGEWLFMLAFSLCFALLPVASDLLTMATVPPDKVYVSANDMNRMVGDRYYYQALVRAVLDYGPFRGNPSAPERLDAPMIEHIRFLAQSLAALPGLVTGDIRLVYVAGMALSGALYFLLPYLLGRFFGLGRGASLGCAAVTYYYQQYWSSLIPAGPLQMPGHGLGEWLWGVFSALPRYRIFYDDVYALDYVGSVMRYVNLAHSGPILLGLTGVIAVFTVRRRLAVAALATLALCLTAVTYTTNLPVVFLIAGFAGLILFFQGERRHAGKFFLVILLALLVLAGSGFPWLLQRTYASDVLWTHIFRNDVIKVVDAPAVVLLIGIVVNKYTVCGALMLWLTRRYRREAFVAVAAIVAAGCAMATLLVVDAPRVQELNRLFARGIDLPWTWALALALAAGWENGVRPRIARTRPLVAGLAGLALLAALLAPPAAGLVRLGLQSFRGETNMIGRDAWDALQWLRRNAAKGAMTASLDWSDITFVPIYTHAGNYAGHFVLDGRTPEEELKRYAAVWKLLELPRSQWQARVSQTVESANLLNKASVGPGLYRPPLVDAWTFASSQIALGLLYWPYLKQAEGVPYSDDALHTAPGFVRYAMEVFDAADVEAARRDIEFLLVSGLESSLPHVVPQGFSEVFSNGSHKIYRHERQRTP